MYVLGTIPFISIAILVSSNRFSVHSRSMRGSSTFSHHHFPSIVRIPIFITSRSPSDVFSLVTEPVDLGASYPSSLTDGGSVRWSKVLASPDGNLAVSFPDIRCAITCQTITAYRFISRVSIVGLPYGRPRDGQSYNIMLSCEQPSLFSLLVPIQNNSRQMSPIF